MSTRSRRDPQAFARTLDAALTASGLPLERVSAHLAKAGHPVTAATLSYWRHGQRIPGRGRSLAALGPLAEVLGLPEDHLRTALFGPAWTTSSSHNFWTLTTVADHVEIELQTRIVLLAQGDDELSQIELPAPAAAQLEITETAGCTVASRLLPSSQPIVATLDRPLASGQATVVELLLHWRQPTCAALTLTFTTPAREIVRQVTFSDHAPRELFNELALITGEHAVSTVPVIVSPAGAIGHVIDLDVAAAQTTLRWSATAD